MLICQLIYRVCISCGSCWTFGTFASLESALLTGETWNFAEQHLNQNHGYDWVECEGGNACISTAYLTRWAGPFNEPEYPYPYTSPTAPVKHVQQAVFLPERASSTDNSAIKYFLTTSGALNFSFYYNGSYFNDPYDAYYYNGASSANHEICLIGWDDNFDKSKFPVAAPGNGAFLCKNSWGTTWGNGGYFWLSYYDASFTECVAFNNAEKATNYRGKYEYDPYGWVSSYGYNDPVVWAANIFTATANDKLSAVGYIVTDSASVDIYVYANVTAGSPRSGTQAAHKTATLAYPGFYTTKLDAPVTLTKNQRFSIVIKFTNTAYGYPCAVEAYYAGYCSAATNTSGQSFLSPDGTSWSDWYDYSSNSNKINNCIKGYLGDACTPNAKDDLVGSWSDGVWYRSSDTGTWHKMGNPASLLTVGDLDSDCVDDLIGVWPSQGGVWARYSQSGAWTLLASTARHITTGDMNGDGKQELLGTWDGQGVYWRDNSSGAWTKLASPATLIAAGDLDADGKDDLIGVWPSQGGVWVKYSQSGAWSKLSSTATDIASGDMNGDGRRELLATYSGQGVYYRNNLTGSWTLMATPATQTTSGDLDGDGIHDLIGIWLGQNGVWVKYSKTGSWQHISSTAMDIAAGKMRASGSAGLSSGMGFAAKTATPVLEPKLGPGVMDFSASGPGGAKCIAREEENLIPFEQGNPLIRRVPGPGEIGFGCSEQPNLKPRREDLGRNAFREN